MKMFLIDPNTRTITEIDSPTDFKSLYPVIGDGCDTIEIAYHAFSGSDDVMYCDENAFINPNLKMFITPRGPFLGRAIVLHMNSHGKEGPPTIDIDELASQVFFPPQEQS